MTDTDLEIEETGTAPPSATAARASFSAVVSIVFQVATTTVGVTGVVWLVGLSNAVPSQLDVRTIIAIAASSAFLASCWGAVIKWRYWSRPSRSLLNAVERARDGEVSIKELSRIGGGIRPLARMVQALLRIQRQQKTDLLELEQEVRDRIANRTNALERKIGSLKHQAMRDVLTGLMNRRAMEQEIPPLLEKHITGSQDACLLMIDVDHFKALNDTLGHVAGDQLLKEIGQIIRSTIRDNDMAFRCGGDEFVILLHDAAPRFGLEISRRLESLVEVLAQPLHLPRPPRLSIGVCALSELEHPSRAAWLDIADKRLYCIKSDRKTHRPGVNSPSTRRIA
jgi:diguanylate cyclase (GGDEF)-like protein